ncbi:uncharacterized protein BDZ99DRAFT_524225 [Mytilinidion resinicola]|uniref:Uncharacterized protein n=1 Tax=Mytilinidion resinicola TaxID=574789 RepID=A0A6A6YBB3_9PEZI|nr:uncharacterized protein BDZ99DRAFT_524225 [Mytilinidion resinicola]KAF2805990.1 hypothetical protein BDZ99DRAFT_524225 [Mytilinidion resinicola]
MEAVDWSIVKNWLESCEKHHRRHCKPSKDSQVLGLLVVDCVTRQVVPHDPSQGCLTLSYVRDNSNATGAEIYMVFLSNKLPATIEDAIKVVNALGYHSG